MVVVDSDRCFFGAFFNRYLSPARALMESGIHNKQLAVIMNVVQWDTSAQVADAKNRRE